MRRAPWCAGLLFSLLAAVASAENRPIAPIPVLVERLRDASESTRREAAWELAWLKKPKGQAASALRELLKSDDPELRHAAAWVLQEGDLRKTDVPPLIARIPQAPASNPAFKPGASGVIRAAVLVGEDGRVAQVGIVDSVRAHDDAAVAWVKQWEFSPAKRDGKPVATRILVPVLLGLPSALPYTVDLPAPTEPIPVLLERLRSADAHIRRQAAWDLAGAGSGHEDVEAALIALLGDDARTVRYATTWALHHVAPERSWANNSSQGLEGATLPTHTFRTVPRYPQEAFIAAVQGTVLLSILIGEDGEVAEIRVAQSIPMLDDAAVACVRQWRFEPGRRNGRPCAVAAAAPITFAIGQHDRTRIGYEKVPRGRRPQRTEATEEDLAGNSR